MHKPYGVYERMIKRPVDFLLALLAFILLSPIMLLVSILVRAKLGSPIIFKQERPGRIDPRAGEESIFCLYKFRTMTDAVDKAGNLLSDEDRLTSFGKRLRSTSLDERVIIGQTTESLENKGFREVSPIHFHRGHDLFFYNARDAIIEGVLCQSA